MCYSSQQRAITALIVCTLELVIQRLISSVEETGAEVEMYKNSKAVRPKEETLNINEEEPVLKCH